MQNRSTLGEAIPCTLAYRHCCQSSVSTYQTSPPILSLSADLTRRLTQPSSVLSASHSTTFLGSSFTVFLSGLFLAVMRRSVSQWSVSIRPIVEGPSSVFLRRVLVLIVGISWEKSRLTLMLSNRQHLYVFFGNFAPSEHPGDTDVFLPPGPPFLITSGGDISGSTPIHKSTKSCVKVEPLSLLGDAALVYYASFTLVQVGPDLSRLTLGRVQDCRPVHGTTTGRLHSCGAQGQLGNFKQDNPRHRQPLTRFTQKQPTHQRVYGLRLGGCMMSKGNNEDLRPTSGQPDQ
ncbi:hypothetical protein OF83DRAFT_61899 [Amylostereum chailletii]|nr:hypothetical protein OF83DRAFT_61899 [Amylostereum chailletii]